MYSWQAKAMAEKSDEYPKRYYFLVVSQKTFVVVCWKAQRSYKHTIYCSAIQEEKRG